MERDPDIENKSTLLVVDNDEDMLALITCFLVDYGYNVLTAKCSKDAVQVFEANKDQIALTFLDMEMLDISGIDALIEIKRISRNAKILLIAGNSTEIIVKRLTASRGVSFIKIPFGNTTLCYQIRNILVG